jgi:uncharacterized phage protein gp47/JayE
MAYGVTDAGFVKKQLTDIKASLEAGVLAAFGSNFDISTESPTGQLIGIFADCVSDVWDAIEQAYAAYSPDGATGVSLDNSCALTGTKREPATYSTVTVTLTGTPGQTISAATFSVQGTSAKFTMDADATIGGGGTVDATCTAVTSGAVIAVAGTLTVIDTPRAGLTSVTNALDAKLGSPIENDPTLRMRREEEIRATGNASTEAIKSKVLETVDANGTLLVTDCTVFENYTDTTDGNGLPPHSINVLASCDPGASIDAAVGAAVSASKGAGIQTIGATTVTITDSQGQTHSVSFDRPTQLLVYVRLDIVVDPTAWPLDGATQIANAILAYGAKTLVAGKDVVSSAIGAQAFQVAGVLDSPLAKIGLAPSPTLTSNIAVSLRQIAVLDSSRIQVFTTNGTP